MLKTSEYRYISPVFEYDRASGELLDIRMAALTNDPGLDGMAAVALTAALAGLTTSGDDHMSLAEIIKALGLPPESDEASALVALTALKAQADAALKTPIPQGWETKPDPAKYVPIAAVETLQQQVAVLSATVRDAEVTKVVDAAEAAGKLVTPDLKAWATDLGRKDLAALKAWVEKSPVIAALTGMQSVGRTPDGKPTVSDEALAVMKAMGLTPDEFSKGKE